MPQDPHQRPFPFMALPGIQATAVLVNESSETLSAAQLVHVDLQGKAIVEPADCRDDCQTKHGIVSPFNPPLPPNHKCLVFLSSANGGPVMNPKQMIREMIRRSDLRKQPKHIQAVCDHEYDEVAVCKSCGFMACEKNGFWEG